MSFNHPATTPELRSALDREVERRFGQFGGVERRGGSPVSSLPTEIEIRASGDPLRDGQMVVKGYASVFNRLSLDLGGFREKIAVGAFDKALAKDNNVLLLWDHDRSYILGSSKATDPESLELRVDPTGLRFFSRVVPTTYANDLQSLMDAGIIREASFAFTVASDEWVEKDGEVTRTVHEVDELYDVTITVQGAYPQTVSQLVRQRAYDFAHESGRLSHEEGADGDVEPMAGTTEESPSRNAGGSVQTEREDTLRNLRARLEAHRTDFQKGKNPK
jgi:HK97 family phage prohead protease